MTNGLMLTFTSQNTKGQWQVPMLVLCPKMPEGREYPHIPTSINVGTLDASWHPLQHLISIPCSIGLALHQHWISIGLALDQHWISIRPALDLNGAL